MCMVVLKRLAQLRLELEGYALGDGIAQQDLDVLNSTDADTANDNHWRNLELTVRSIVPACQLGLDADC